MRRAHALTDRTSAYVADQDVRTHLNGLLQNSAFDASPRNRRFLSYVVEETLSGRADRLKAYSIAIAAFGRDEDFDPLTDPIVRIEAARLRRSLERYYLTAGKQERLRIEIPKGSYVAVFTHLKQVSSPVVPANSDDPGDHPTPVAVAAAGPLNRRSRKTGILSAAALFAAMLALLGVAHDRLDLTATASNPELPALVILPFEDISGGSKRSAVAASLTYEVTAALTQIREVAVFGSFARAEDKAEDRRVQADYILEGFVQGDDDDVRISAFVVDSRTGQYLRSWHFETDLMKDGIHAEAKIAEEIRRALETACTAGGGAGFNCRPSLGPAAR